MNKNKLRLVSEKFADESVLVHHNARVIDSDGNIIDVLWPKIASSFGDLLVTGPWSFSLGFTQVLKRPLWFRYLWESVDCNFPNERLAHDQWVFFWSSFWKNHYVDQELVDTPIRQQFIWCCGIYRLWMARKTEEPVAAQKPALILDEDGERFCRLANIGDNELRY
jgi:hypothetical protein